MRGHTGRVILLGHANPDSAHAAFFDTMKDFIADDLHNRVPIVYLNAHGHEWKHETSYFGQKSWLRIMVAGMTQEPPTLIEVVATGEYVAGDDAFLHDRSGKVVCATHT